MKSKPSASYRCDLLAHAMNTGKEKKVRALLRSWREVAVAVGKEQWQLFYTTGAVGPRTYGTAGMGILGTNHRQMIYAQVAGQLSSWLGNRQNEFRDLVQGSSLPPDLKHQLHVINRLKAWHRPGDLQMRDGRVIDRETRHLARRLFAKVCRRHRRPRLDRINMMIDQRAVTLTENRTDTDFPLWARLSTLEKGAPIWVPLKTHAHFEQRRGTRSLSLQINDSPAGLRFGVLTDVSAALAESRAAYVPRTDAIALDLGLRTLFATDQGDLLGQGWMDRLQRIDARLKRLAAHRQRMLPADARRQHGRGRRVASPRYRGYVQKLRGYIDTEVNRILNRLVVTRAPAAIIIEHLRFQSPELSRRMNRLLSWFGKSAIEAKLKALQEAHGIQVHINQAAYSSQECASCGYVDKRNRPRQAAFACLWCGHTHHADVNAAKVLMHRRSVQALSDPKRHRSDVLGLLVRQHAQRYTRRRAKPEDPRITNPYFREWRHSVSSIAGTVETHRLSTGFCK